MLKKRIIILVFMAVLSVGITTLVLLSENGVFLETHFDKKVFPDLDKTLKNTIAISIEHKKTPVTLVADANGDWYVGEIDAYPAKQAEVKNLIDALANIQFGIKKGEGENALDMAGLHTPDREKAESYRISFISKDGDILAGLLIGNKTDDDFTFIRKNDEEQVWLTNFPFAIDAKEKPLDWVETELLKLKSDDILKITMIDPVASPIEEVIFERNEGEKSFKTVQNQSKRREIHSEDGEKLANAFALINFENAKMITEDTAEKIKTLFKTEIETKDGDIYGLIFVNFNDDVWFRLYSSDKTFNKKHALWIYKFPMEKVLELLPPESMAEK